MSPAASSGPAWPARLRSRSVALSTLDPTAALPDWIEAAGLDVAGAAPPCLLTDAVARGDAAYWIRATTPQGRAVVGALAAQLDGDALLWSWLAVQPPYRAYGFGAAAVALLERAAARLGATRAAVLAPAANGIALYFWLRLGYAAGRARRRRSPRDGTWMSRTLGP